MADEIGQLYLERIKSYRTALAYLESQPDTFEAYKKAHELAGSTISQNTIRVLYSPGSARLLFGMQLGESICSEEKRARNLGVSESELDAIRTPQQSGISVVRSHCNECNRRNPAYQCTNCTAYLCDECLEQKGYLWWKKHHCPTCHTATIVRRT